MRAQITTRAPPGRDEPVPRGEHHSGSAVRGQERPARTMRGRGRGVEGSGASRSHNNGPRKASAPPFRSHPIGSRRTRRKSSPMTTMLPRRRSSSTWGRFAIGISRRMCRAAGTGRNRGVALSPPTGVDRVLTRLPTGPPQAPRVLTRWRAPRCVCGCWLHRPPRPGLLRALIPPCPLPIRWLRRGDTR